MFYQSAAVATYTNLNLSHNSLFCIDYLKPLDRAKCIVVKKRQGILRAYIMHEKSKLDSQQQKYGNN